MDSSKKLKTTTTKELVEPVTEKPKMNKNYSSDAEYYTTDENVPDTTIGQRTKFRHVRKTWLTDAQEEKVAKVREVVPQQSRSRKRKAPTPRYRSRVMKKMVPKKSTCEISSTDSESEKDVQRKGRKRQKSVKKARRDQDMTSGRNVQTKERKRQKSVKKTRRDQDMTSGLVPNQTLPRRVETSSSNIFALAPSTSSVCYKKGHAVCVKDKKSGQICSAVRNVHRGDNSQNRFSGKIETLDEEEHSTNVRGKKRAVRTKTKVCTTIVVSSDEESGQCNDKGSIPSVLQQLPPQRILDKEPIITKTHSSPEEQCEEILRYISNIESNNRSGENVSTSCRVACKSVRIGSYEATPVGGVSISKSIIKIIVPSIDNENINDIVTIPQTGVAKVLAYFRFRYYLFVYLEDNYAAVVRHMLRMEQNSRYYYDPTSTSQLVKRIILDLHEIPVETRHVIEQIYEDRPDALVYLTFSEFNLMLLKCTPSEKCSQPKSERRSQPEPKQLKDITLTVYPAPPAKGGVTIGAVDYATLSKETFIDDVIIDFYLQYISYKYYPSEDKRSRFHIFSTFFYKRLTTKSPPPKSCKTVDLKDLAAVRHSRVMKWTKNVNIFEKDFIIIPIVQNSHWFLAVICYPGLEGPEKISDGTRLPLIQSKVKPKPKNRKMKNKKDKGKGKGKAKQQKVRNGHDEDEEEKRDEADGDDEDVYYYDCSSDDEADPAPGEAIRQPCILVFDSLPYKSRAPVIATLREYLAEEYKAKFGLERSFSKFIVKGDCPDVPHQNNAFDCGLFLMEYVETLFKEGIPDYRVPITYLKTWFDPTIVYRKRRYIHKLILNLLKQENKDIKSLNLPTLIFESDCEDSTESSDDSDTRTEGDKQNPTRVEHKHSYSKGSQFPGPSSSKETEKYEKFRDYRERCATSDSESSESPSDLTD